MAKVTQIKIVNYQGYVFGDENITPNSIHSVIESPDNKSPNGKRGYWVKNARNKPILILLSELTVVTVEQSEF